MSNNSSLSKSIETQYEVEEEIIEQQRSRIRTLPQFIKAQLTRYQLSLYIWNNLFVVIGIYVFNIDIIYWFIFWVISTLLLILARASQLYSVNIRNQPQIVSSIYSLSAMKTEPSNLQPQTSNQVTEVHSIEEQTRLVWKEAFSEQMRIEGVNSPVYIIQNSAYNSNNTITNKPKPGLTKLEIKALGSSAFSKEQIDGQSEGSNACSICLREYEPDKKIVILQCKHYYHSHCIRLWLETHTKCPLCRQPVQ